MNKLILIRKFTIPKSFNVVIKMAAAEIPSTSKSPNIPILSIFSTAFLSLFTASSISGKSYGSTNDAEVGLINDSTCSIVLICRLNNN